MSGKKPYMHLVAVGDELIAHDRYRCRILNRSQFDSSAQDSSQAHKQLSGLMERDDIVYLNVQPQEQLIVAITGSLSAGFGSQQQQLLRP